MILETLIEVGSLALSTIVLILMLHDLPGLFSLLGMRRTADWLEARVDRLPKLPAVFYRNRTE